MQTDSLDLDYFLHASLLHALNFPPVDLMRVPVCKVSVNSSYLNEEMVNAYRQNNMTKLSIILDSGADLEYAWNGFTLLQHACQDGKFDLVTELCSRGVAIDQVSPRFEGENTPWHLACKNGHVKVCKILYGFGADINRVNADGDLGFYLACVNGHSQVVQFCRDKIDGLEIIEKYPELLVQMIKAQNTLIVKDLIGLGYPLNYQDLNGWTLLHYAAMFSNLEICELLVDSGCDVTVRNHAGESVSRLAKFNNQDVYRFLR